MRNNIKDDFEKVYLRYNMLLRNVEHANLKHTKTSDYRKSVKYIVYSHYRRFSTLYSFNGFDYDDIYSIAKTFSLAYLGLPEVRKKRKIDYKNMIRFIGQKLSDLAIMVERKFKISDIVGMYSSTKISYRSTGEAHESALLFERGSKIKNTSIFGTENKNPEEIYLEGRNFEENLILDQMEELEIEKVIVKSSNSDGLDKTRALKAISQKGVGLKKRLRAVTGDDETILSKFNRQQKKREVIDNKAKYADTLCYHATSKHVDNGVRKVAVKMCKQMGIDYVAWLKIKLQERPEDSPNYTY